MHSKSCNYTGTMRQVWDDRTVEHSSRCILTTFSVYIPTCFSWRQERAAARQQREIGNVREGLVEGGDALAQGFYRGFTGLVTKPLQGARTGVGGKPRCQGTGFSQNSHRHMYLLHGRWL